jgi:indole-3-glycerol phosphate synthase
MSLIDELVANARKRAEALPPREHVPRRSRPSFREALRGKAHLDVIAEFKRASPSLGAIAERGLEDQVRRYAQAGAAAISVLTEPSRFKGSLSDLERTVASVEVPVLMKDFVVHPAQIREAAFLGASAVLLIVRCLSREQLSELAQAAEELGLTPLVECHHARELERALEIEDAVIGVNNRDLDTLAIDTSLSPRALADVPRERVVVAESGYEHAEDVAELRGVADAVLVGSALMKLGDPTQRIQEIRG